MQSYKLLDYNDILRIINKSLGVFLCISLIILIGEDQSTYHSPVFPGSEVYVDVVTVIISLLIMVVCECMLIHERNESDPFVLFLMTNIIFFYLLRVLTLLFFPLSFVLPRFNSGVSDINQSLWFILFGIIAIFIGLKAFKVRQSFVCDNSTNQEFSANKPYITLLLLLSLLTNAFYWFRYYFFDSTPFSIGDRVSNYLTIVFNLDLSLLLVLVFLIKYWKELSKLKRCLLGVPLMLFLFTRTMGGSRSAIMTLGIIFLSAAMPVLGRIRVKVKVVLICIAIFFVTVPLFAYANFVRDYADLEYRSRHSFTGYLMDIYNGTSGNRVIPSILARAGYLDMATDMIVNRESYEKLINFNYYIQSIIDNGLTPGVNIFDRPKVPKASNALKHCYNPETKKSTLFMDPTCSRFLGNSTCCLMDT